MGEKRPEFKAVLLLLHASLVLKLKSKKYPAPWKINERAFHISQKLHFNAFVVYIKCSPICFKIMMKHILNTHSSVLCVCVCVSRIVAIGYSCTSFDRKKAIDFIAAVVIFAKQETILYKCDMKTYFAN